MRVTVATYTSLLNVDSLLDDGLDVHSAHSAVHVVGVYADWESARLREEAQLESDELDSYPDMRPDALQWERVSDDEFHLLAVGHHHTEVLGILRTEAREVK